MTLIRQISGKTHISWNLRHLLPAPTNSPRSCFLPRWHSSGDDSTFLVSRKPDHAVQCVTTHNSKVEITGALLLFYYIFLHSRFNFLWKEHFEKKLKASHKYLQTTKNVGGIWRHPKCNSQLEHIRGKREQITRIGLMSSYLKTLDVYSLHAVRVPTLNFVSESFPVIITYKVFAFRATNEIKRTLKVGFLNLLFSYQKKSFLNCIFQGNLEKIKEANWEFWIASRRFEWIRRKRRQSRK